MRACCALSRVPSHHPPRERAGSLEIFGLSSPPVQLVLSTFHIFELAAFVLRFALHGWTTCCLRHVFGVFDLGWFCGHARRRVGIGPSRLVANEHTQFPQKCIIPEETVLCRDTFCSSRKDAPVRVLFVCAGRSPYQVCCIPRRTLFRHSCHALNRLLSLSFACYLLCDVRADPTNSSRGRVLLPSQDPPSEWYARC